MPLTLNILKINNLVKGVTSKCASPEICWTEIDAARLAACQSSRGERAEPLQTSTGLKPDVVEFSLIHFFFIDGQMPVRMAAQGARLSSTMVSPLRRTPS